MNLPFAFPPFRSWFQDSTNDPYDPGGKTAVKYMKKDFCGGINVNMNEYVSHEVHRLYYDYDENCARTTLKCLSHLFSFPINDDVFSSAIGMHGAGFYRAQCGLVEGTLMFIGLYGVGKGLLRDEIVKLCYDYASSFEKEFSSLRCRELRPGGFSPSDPPHLCEDLTCRALEFGYEFITKRMGLNSSLSERD